jgi:hypothetical protein
MLVPCGTMRLYPGLAVSSTLGLVVAVPHDEMVYRSSGSQWSVAGYDAPPCRDAAIATLSFSSSPGGALLISPGRQPWGNRSPRSTDHRDRRITAIDGSPRSTDHRDRRIIAIDGSSRSTDHRVPVSTRRRESAAHVPHPRRSGRKRYMSRGSQLWRVGGKGG